MCVCPCACACTCECFIALGADIPEVAQACSSLSRGWKPFCPSHSLDTGFGIYLAELHPHKPKLPLSFFSQHTHTHGCCAHPTSVLSILSSSVSWCCSDNLAPPGLARFAPFLFLLHRPLLCLDRTTWCCCRLPDFGISCVMMGQKDSLDERRPLAARERSASCPAPAAARLRRHTWMHSRSGSSFACTHIQTVN